MIRPQCIKADENYSLRFPKEEHLRYNIIEMKFTGERFIPEANGVEPTFQQKMWQEHLNRYQFAGYFVKGKDVLDLGCGVGYGSDYLMKECDPKSVVGVDISKKAIDFAKSHYKRKGLKFLISGAENILLPDKSVDVAIALELVEHVDDCKKVLSEVKRILRKEGVFIVSTPRKKEAPQSAFHTHEFTLEEFNEVLSSRFSPVKFYSQNRLHIAVITNDYTFSRGFEEIKTIKYLCFEGSDYFVAVCGKVEGYPRTLGVFNDDSYPLKLEKDVGIFSRALDDCKGEVGKLQKEVESLQKKAESFQKELNEIYRSRAWKLVIFLRKIKHFLISPRKP